MKTPEADVIPINTTSEAEIAGFSLPRGNSSQEDLRALLDTANRTIGTLEKRIAMQERSYTIAMREKNRKIRELELRLQGKE